MRAVLGMDTSCYTTSCALVTPEGEILSSSRRLLTVEDGARGLMQSQGLFQHVKNLPQMVQNVMADVSDAEICAVCASTRPRPAEDSYMPVFRAGESQARAAASLLRVPFYPASHQEGHVRAAMVDAGIDETKPFLALHLSGGTTEILLSEEGKLTLLGGSLDLHAGQLVDRTGVRLHMPFPAGPSLEKLAMEGRAQGVCERGSYYELTDAELTASYPLGVSNEYAAGSDCITISTRSGALVVVETIAD